MADYRIQNQVPYPSQQLLVNQNPPIQALTQGLEQGATLGLQAAQQRRLAEQQQQAMELAKRDQADKDFNSFGVAIKNLHGIPDDIKPHYWDNVVLPKAQAIGLNVSPGWNPNTDVPMTEKIKQLYDHHKKNPKDFTMDDVIGGIHLLAMTSSESGQEQESKTLMDIANQESDLQKSRISGGSAEKGQFVGIQSGQGVIWNPVSKSFELKPLPGEGTFLGKSEPGKIGQQTIQNDEALSLVDDLESKLKGSSGLAGGIKSLASKATAGAISPELRIYNQQKPAVAVKLYRAITGDTRLSDADAAARALPLLPDTYEASDVQSGKIKAMRDAINGKNSNLASLLSGVPGEPTPSPAPTQPPAIVQRNKKTGAIRKSYDGGKTWQNQ